MKIIFLSLFSTLLLCTTATAQSSSFDAPGDLSIQNMSVVKYNDGTFNFSFQVTGVAGATGIVTISTGSIIHYQAEAEAGDVISEPISPSPEHMEARSGETSPTLGGDGQYIYRIECHVVNSYGEDSDGCDVPLESGQNN